jgi:hypothetical protein
MCVAKFQDSLYNLIYISASEQATDSSSFTTTRVSYKYVIDEQQNKYKYNCMCNNIH